MMRTFLMAALAASALFAAAGSASAQRGDALSRAVSMCRAEIAERAGVDADQVQFASVRTSSGAYRINFRLTRADQREAVRCDISRGEDMQIAALTPDPAPVVAAQPAPATP